MISESEFIELFNLDNSYTIPKETIEIYCGYIEGLYKLYHSFNNLEEKELKVKTIDNGELIVKGKVSQKSWRNIIFFSTNRPELEVLYKRHDGQWWHFWSTGDVTENSKNICYTDYSHYVLKNLLFDYLKHFSIDVSFKHRKRKHFKEIDIAWDDVEFRRPLSVIDGDGIYRVMKPYEIVGSITNKQNVWLGNTPSPILDYIKENKEKWENIK